MCRFDRGWRKKYEGRDRRVEKRCGTERTDEVRKWDERPKREVEENGDLIVFNLNQTDKPLQIRQTGSVKKSKLIRSLR